MDPHQHTPRHAPSIGLIVGAATGGGPERPRSEAPAVDVLLMRDRFGAALLDFTELERLLSNGVLGRGLLRLVRRTGQWSLALAVLAWRRRRDLDALYLTGEDIGVPLAILLRLSRSRTPALVMRLEQPTYGRTALRRALYNTLLAVALPRIDMIACRTSAHLNYLNSVLRVPHERLVLVSETTDPVYFDPAAHDDGPPSSLRLDERPLIVSAGLEMRDYASLIEAARGLDVRVVIAAGSPWSNEVYQVDGDLPDNVTVASFSRPQMRWLYRAASIVVVPVKPTLRACGMNVLLEAWAMERPVVMSRTSGQYDYVTDGVTAVLVPPCDSGALRATIEDLLADPARRTALGAAGRAEVVAERNVDRYVERIEELLRRVLARAGMAAVGSPAAGGEGDDALETGDGRDRSSGRAAELDRATAAPGGTDG